MLNDVNAAIRVVASDDAVLEVTSEVLQSLRIRHPPDPEDSLAPTISVDNIAVSADYDEIMRSLWSLSSGCCGGIDGLRPAHLLNLVSYSTAVAGLRHRQSIDGLRPAHLLNLVSYSTAVAGLRHRQSIDGLRPAHLLNLVSYSTAVAGLRHRQSIANFTNEFICGDISDYAAKLLFSANLTALRKKDSGIRPVAVGNVLRRLTARVVVNSPYQSPRCGISRFRSAQSMTIPLSV